ncbi:hypothetical protein BVRB_042820, partial [Beta vulgaris subsp. vulgaris]
KPRGLAGLVMMVFSRLQFTNLGLYLYRHRSRPTYRDHRRRYRRRHHRLPYRAGAWAVVVLKWWPERQNGIGR